MKTSSMMKMLTQITSTDIINRCQFGNDNFIPPSSGFNHSVFEHPMAWSWPYFYLHNDNKQCFSFFSNNLIVNSWISHRLHRLFNVHSRYQQRWLWGWCISTNNPTIAGVAKRLARFNGKLLDEKQYITYDILCCTFLLQLLNKALDPTSSVHTQIAIAISQDDNSDMIDDIREQLLARGGMYQLLLFLQVR
jgi:hypothetical protein